jgi:hypothetical protein
MSAQRLRDAVLKLRAQAAIATDKTINMPMVKGMHINGGHYLTTTPDLVLALADWLDDIEVLWSSAESMADGDGDPLTFGESIDSHALKVCDAILGSDS